MSFESAHQYEALQQAVTVIRAKLPELFQPKLAIILGSGLGPLADQLERVATIPYDQIPGFHMSTVPGHSGNLVAGYLQGLPVLCLQGRVHFYEGAPIDALRVMVRSLKFMGCEALLLASACGSFHREVPPGELMVIKDHINFQGINPLIGPNDDRIGPRFVAMDNAYDSGLRARLHVIADKMKIKLHEGVYFSVLGPSFETPAEIRAFRTLGADAIGMSTVPEVILARHCDLKVVCIGVITNFTAGMTDHTITHEEHIRVSTSISGVLTELVKNFAGDLAAHA